MQTLFPIALALSLATSIIAQSPIVAVWNFDQTTGLLAPDLIQGNDGTLNGFGASGTWVTGQFGNALRFDGVDDYVSITTPNGLPIYRGDGSPFSVAFWVKAPPGDDDRVYSEGQATAGTNGGSLFTIGTGRTSLANTDKLQVYIRDELQRLRALYSAATVFDDTWHHIAYVDVAGDARLYIDGVQDTNSFDYRSSPNGPRSATYGPFAMNRVSIGAVERSNVVAHLNGTIDELHVFAYALSAADVAGLLQNTLPATCRASLAEFGIGCGTTPFELTAGGSAQISGPGVSLTFQNGPPLAPAFLLFSLGRVAPIDLTPLGFSGCRLYGVNPVSFAAGSLDSTGRSAPLTIPAAGPNLACVQVVFQGAAIQTTPSPQLRLSNVVQAYLGF